MSVKFIKVSDTITADLAKKVRAMNNPQKALQAAGTVLVSLAKRAFNEADVRPLPWDPLKPATIAAKKRKGYSEGILKASGALMKSPRIIEVTDTSVRVGTDRPYARYHQEGTSKMPPRPFFPISPDGELTEKAGRLVRSAIVRAINAEMKG